MNALRSMLEKQGAQFRDQGAAPVPARFGTPEVELLALRRRCTVVDRSARGRIELSGGERLSFLQALFTNDVVTPAPGAVIYGFFLTAQGRLVADARVLRLEDRLWLDVEPAARKPVLAFLEKYHFSEDVAFHDVTAATAALGLFGPKAPATLEFALGAGAVPAANAFTRVGDAVVAANALTGDPGFDLIVPAAAAAELYAKVLGLQAEPCGWDALEIARIEAGVPRLGAELDASVIPLEAGLGPAGISFTKGCYVGQEIIARIDSRGEPARRLVGFSIDGPLPAPGTPIRQGDKEVGVLVTAVVSPSLRGRPIGMGYVHKSVDDRAENLTAGDTKLWIVPRPFYPPQH
jgi:folate-binding protein YgfZ